MLRRLLAPRTLVALAVLGAEVAIAGCGVDSYLTCGAACDEAGADATTADAASDGQAQDAPSQDAAPDVAKDSGGGCGNDSGFCQSNAQCCVSDPVCTAGHRCATSCGAVDASCSDQPDTCCPTLFCANGRCSACRASEAGCSEDYQCCSGVCYGNSTCQ